MWWKINPDWPQIRVMVQADVPAVMEVELASYEFPWTTGIFRDCIKGGYSALVCEIDGRIIGYGMTSAGAGEAHLLNLCVLSEYRHRGLGSSLLEQLLAKVTLQGARLIYLEVRASNLAAIDLYVRRGFKEVGLRRGYYPAETGREDGVVLSLELV